MNKNNYKIIDHGLLTPVFNTYIVQPLLKKLPSFVTPSFITVLSFFCSTLGLASALYFGHTTAGVFLTAFFQFLYVLSTHLVIDNEHQEKTLPALWGFLTQFHNIYGIATIHFTAFYFFQVTTPFILVFSLTLNYLYACKKFTDLYKNGEMVMPKFSSWEQLLIVKATYFLSLHPSAHAVLVDFIEFILFISVTANILIYMKEILKTLKETWQFALYLALMLSFHYFLPDFYAHRICAFILLFNLHFIGSVIAARLTSSHYPLPDLIAPLFLIIAPSTNLTYGLALCYLAARVCCLFFKTVAKLESYEKI